MASALRQGGTRFFFVPMDPENGTELKQRTIYFRAHISNINDTNSGNWEEHRDIGRADPKFMYSSWSRTISLDFQIIATTRDEMDVWYGAMNSLVELTKPKYVNNLGYNGVMTKMVVGDLYKVIGMIQSVDYSINNETPWVDTSQFQFFFQTPTTGAHRPVYIDAGLTMRVVQSKRPNYENSDYNFFKPDSFGRGSDA